MKRLMSLGVRWRVVGFLTSMLGSALMLVAPVSAGTSAEAWKTLSYRYAAPAGTLPATKETYVNGYRVAILPNGRFLTPAGVEVDVQAPKPFGMAISPDDDTLATINSGAGPFSITLIRKANSGTPAATRIDVNATFMGIVFSPDGKRLYASGGENGNIWVIDVASGKVVASVNLNGPSHAVDPISDPTQNPNPRFKGAFPGNMVLSQDGTYLYVVDQAGFKLHVVDTTQITKGLAEDSNNFAALVKAVDVGRYPYGISLSPDGRKLFVTHVGVFQYSHLGPSSPTGDPNKDYPLCYPGVGYPDETTTDRTIAIKKVDPRDLPDSLRDPDGIRCGYITPDRIEFTVPGLGDPNAKESSSVYVFDLSNPKDPHQQVITKTGPRVGDYEDGIKAYSGSHPNAVAVSPEAIYVANGNNDTVSVLDPGTYREVRRIELSPLIGPDQHLKGIQPVALALSPDHDYLYVAEAGINAVGVIDLDRRGGRVIGHIPVGWWPSTIRVSSDGQTLYVANARGRGAGPNNTGSDSGSPKFSVLGTVNVLAVPSAPRLFAHSLRVLANNGFVPIHGKDGEDEEGWRHDRDRDHPIPDDQGERSKQIKHVIFVNKENATHDLLLGCITQTRKGVPVEGKPEYCLGEDAAPNHLELARQFALSDNFFLEPSVSSDGHRWLTNTYTTEFEETHWPASYGGKRRDAGDDPAVFGPYPGRLGFTDANASPDPNDYNQHGGIYLHLTRHGRTFVNFGNGYEFAEVDEDYGTEPTGIRNHVNVPMEKVVRDNSDHLYPEFNTHIPDAPLPEDKERFSRFGRFKQVFESRFVDRDRNRCMLPDYVDLYYPNDHGGGARDINPGGPDWSFKRFVQDNDEAVGLTVELISKSPCWKDTVIFVTEDDTQNGLDHVDGHRTVFLAIGPWVKREYVSKTHASLASIFKTVNQILGLPPLNQYDAAATDLRDLFTGKPDFTPYKSQNIQYVKGASPIWLALSKEIDFSRPDIDEVRLRNAIVLSEGIPRTPPTHAGAPSLP